MKITVILPNGQEETQVFSQPMVTVGRSNKSDFVVLDESLSRQHCQIELTEGEFYITDLGSSNGVFLDGTRIPPSTRTHFTTFLQLHIGSLECQVSDEDGGSPQAAHSAPASTGRAQQKKSSESTATKLSQPALSSKSSKGAPLKGTKKPEKKGVPLSVIAILIIAAGAWYQFSGEEKLPEGEKSLEVIQVEKNVPPQLRSTKDEFLSAAEYEAKESEKNCTTFEEYCKSMTLSFEDGEGIAQAGTEYFVYMNPELHLTHSLIQPPALEKSDFSESASIFALLNSKMAQDFKDKKVSQIHLIIKNPEGKSKKVFRFHVKYYAGNERARLLTELVPVMGSGESKTFWEYAKPIIKVLEL